MHVYIFINIHHACIYLLQVYMCAERHACINTCVCLYWQDCHVWMYACVHLYINGCMYAYNLWATRTNVKRARRASAVTTFRSVSTCPWSVVCSCVCVCACVRACVCVYTRPMRMSGYVNVGRCVGDCRCVKGHRKAFVILVVYMYNLMYVCAHVFIIQSHVCVCVYVCMCVFVHTSSTTLSREKTTIIRSNQLVKRVKNGAPHWLYVCVRAHARMCICVHVCMHICVCVYTNRYTCMCNAYCMYICVVIWT